MKRTKRESLKISNRLNNGGSARISATVTLNNNNNLSFNWDVFNMRPPSRKSRKSVGTMKR